MMRQKRKPLTREHSTVARIARIERISGARQSSHHRENQSDSRQPRQQPTAHPCRALDPRPLFRREPRGALRQDDYAPQWRRQVAHTGGRRRRDTQCADNLFA